MRKFSRNLLTSLISFVTVTSTAYAITLPTTTDPGRIQEELSKRVPREPKARFEPITAEKPPSALPAEALQIKFQLNGVNIQGATVYSKAELARIYQPYLHKTVPLLVVQKIADDITAKYRNDGYILTKAIIPPQRIKEGVVTIKVIEGYISGTAVVGQTMGTDRLLQAYVHRAAGQCPARLESLERYALLANDIPGISVKTVLSPSKTAVGASDLTFVTKPSRYNGYLSFDNRGTRYLGPQEVLFGANLNSIFNPGDSTGVRGVVTTNPEELRFFELNHDEPIGTDGMRLFASAQNTVTKPGYTLEPLNVRGESNGGLIRLTYPLIRARSKNLNLTATLDGVDTKTDILGTLLSDDHIRSFRLGANFELADSWRGVNQAWATISRGLLILGSSHRNDANLSRVGGCPDYLKYNLELSRTQGLWGPFSMVIAATGQATPNSLLATEQFGYGGVQYGRAYDPSEILGDRGLAGKAGLFYSHAVNKRYFQQFQLYTYYDVGVVRNINPTNQYAQASGSSLGVGVRLGFTPKANASLEFTQPLTRPVAALSELGGNGKAPRIFFTITFLTDGFAETTLETAPPPAPRRPETLGRV